MRFFFADCVLDTTSHMFSRGGAQVPVEPQVFDLLHLLAENGGALVSKDQMIEEVWSGRIVSEATISARINAARAAVGDTGKDQRIIRTVPRRGFEMVAAVTTEAPEAAIPAPALTQTIRYTTSADGTQIAYAVSGDGPPLLRAGHFLTHLEKDWLSPVFRPWLEHWSAQHRLVRYDQRGTGLSQTDVADLSIEAYAADLLAVADAAGLDRFPIFAASQGVPIAIHIAANHPERISRLVLYGGFAKGRLLRTDNHSREEAEALITLMRMGWGKPDSPFMSAFISMFCPEATRADRASLVDTQLASATGDTAARIRIAFDGADVSSELARVKAPTLVLHSSGDAVHPLSQGRLLAANIPGAEFKMIDSNNHIFLKSTPAFDEIMTATDAFLSRDGA